METASIHQCLGVLNGLAKIKRGDNSALAYRMDMNPVEPFLLSPICMTILRCGSEAFCLVSQSLFIIILSSHYLICDGVSGFAGINDAPFILFSFMRFVLVCYCSRSIGACRLCVFSKSGCEMQRTVRMKSANCNKIKWQAHHA